MGQEKQSKNIQFGRGNHETFTWHSQSFLDNTGRRVLWLCPLYTMALTMAHFRENNYTVRDDYS